MWNPEERQVKVFQRNRFLKGVGRRHHYLTLPGEDCADIELALQLNILNKRRSSIVAVEREADEYGYIMQWFARNWPQAKPGPRHAGLCNVRDLDKLDLVFLDYMGNVTQQDAAWMRTCLAQALIPGANVGITACQAYRNNRFIPAVGEQLRWHHLDYFRSVQRSIRDQCGLPKGFLHFAAIYYILARCYFFPNHDFHFQPCYYKEPSRNGMMMMLFNLENFQEIDDSGLIPEQVAVEKTIHRIVAASSDGIEFLITKPMEIHPVSHKKVASAKPDLVHRDQVAQALLDATTAEEKKAAEALKRKHIRQQIDAGKRADYAERWIKARMTVLSKARV